MTFICTQLQHIHYTHAPVAAETRQVAQQAVLVVLGGVAAGVALVLLLLVLLVTRHGLGVLRGGVR